MKILRTGLLAALALLASACSQLPDSTAQLTRQPDTRVIEGQLTNGLRYRLLPTNEQPARLYIRLRVNAGAVDETADQVGVAHLLEHLLFYNRDATGQTVRQRLLAAGWQQGRHFNAMTNAERTQYLFSPPAGNRNSELALQVLAQLVLQQDFAADDLEQERPIVIEEWRGGLGVAQRMNAQRRDSQRIGSGYAGHPTIGSEAAIRQTPVTQLWDFHQRWYAPNNMQLNIVGDFDPAQLQQQLARTLGTARARPVPKRNLELPYLPGLKAFHLHDSESGSHQLNLLFRGHYAANREDSLRGQRERLLDRVAGRLLLRQLQRQPLPDGVRAFSAQRALIGEQSEVTALSASLEQSVHRDALGALLTEVQRLRRFGFYAADLEAEKASLREVAERMLERGDERNFTDWVQLLNDPSQADRTIQTRSTIATNSLPLIDAITLEEINQRFIRWTDSDDLVLQMSAPRSQPLTLLTEADYQQLLNAIDIAALDAPAPEQRTVEIVIPALPASEHTGTIAAVQQYPAEQVQYWTLSNGDRLVWLYQANDDDEAHLQIESGSGYRQPDSPHWLEQSASQLVWQTPPQGFDEAQWDAWQQREKLYLSQDQQQTVTHYSLRVEPARLGEAFALYRSRITRGTLADEALEQLREDLGKRLQQPEPTTRQQQEQRLAQLRYGPQPSSLPSVDELNALTRTALLERWQRQAAAPVTYYLVADVEEAQLREWVSAELAGIVRTPAAPTTPLLQQPGARQTRLANSIEPRASLKVYGYAEHPWSPADAVRVASLRQLASDALKARLRAEARGLYQLTFDSELNPATNRLESRLLFTCDPQRIDELWQEAEAVLAELPAHIDAQRIAQLRAKLRRDEQARLRDGATQLRRLMLSDQRWGDPRYLSSQQDLPDALQVDALRELAGHLLPADNRVRLDVMPHKEPDA